MRRRRAVVLSMCLVVAACAGMQDALEHAGLSPPNVTIENVELVQLPSPRALSAYVCPRVLEQRVGLQTGATLLCSQLFGPVPAPEALGVSFDLHMNVTNPNRVPLPLASALTALTLFPGEEQQELGAACVHLCAEGKQCTEGGANDCPSNATNVTQPAEVTAALGRLLVTQGARLASGQPVGVEAPEVLAQEQQGIVVRFAVDPQQLLPVLERVARQSAAQLEQGETITLALPYSIRGTLFANGGSTGTLAAPFGPTQGTWSLDRALALVPQREAPTATSRSKLPALSHR